MITLLIIGFVSLVGGIFFICCDCEDGFGAIIVGCVLLLFCVLIITSEADQTYTAPATVIGYGVMEDKTLFDADGNTIVVDGLYESGNYILEFDSNGTRNKSDDYVVNVYRSEK